MPERTSFFSVKVILIALYGLAAATLIGISGLSMNSAWRQQAKAERGAEVSTVTRHLFQAMQDVRLERGTVSTALLDRTPLDAATEQLRKMKADGVVLDPDGGTADDYAHLVTADPDIARKYDMHDEAEFFVDDEEEEEPGA